MRDPIERQDAVDALQKEIDKWTPPFDHVIGAVRCGVRLARNIIEDLPSAQPEPRWIPCSERLPEKEVLCCDDSGDMIIGYPYADKDTDTGFCAESDGTFLFNCVAWMPMPKPYGGDGE